MPIPTIPRSLPSLKRYLYFAYSDINDVERRIRPTWWDGELSDLEKAVILLEDRRYNSHSGIDFRSIAREFLKKITFRRHGRASTIEMQFIRTCTGYKDVTARRKIYEMFLAWALLHRATKLEILRSYLEIAYFGTGIRGHSKAATKMFGKQPFELSQDESFQLASMLVYPRPREPDEKWWSKMQRRAQYGQRLLAKYGDFYLS